MNAVVTAIGRVAEPAAPMVTLRMEPGQEEVWQAMEALSKRDGGFTLTDVVTAAECSAVLAERYLAQLVRHGLARELGLTEARETLFQVDWRQWPPVFDDQGRPSRAFDVRAALWRAAKILKIFTARELAFHASTSALEVKTTSAARVIERLEEAGYLVQCGLVRGERQWKLRIGMNTGPLPTRPCEARLMYDLNRRCFVGHGVLREVRL